MHPTQQCSRVVGPSPAGSCTAATGVPLQHAPRGVRWCCTMVPTSPVGCSKLADRVDLAWWQGAVQSKLQHGRCAAGGLPANTQHVGSICQRCLHAAHTIVLFHLLLCNLPADLAGSNKVVLPNNVETMQSSAITVLSLEEGDVHQVCSLEVGAGWTSAVQLTSDTSATAPC